MNYEKNKEFVKYYIENVINDMYPIIINLFDETIKERKLFYYEIYNGPYYCSVTCNKEIPLDSPRPEYRLDYDTKGNVKIKTIRYTEEIVKTPKYTEQEINNIILEMINKNELEKFRKIFEFYKPMAKESITRLFRYSEEKIMDIFEYKYEQYFRDERRRIRKIERNKRKELKNI